MEYQCVVTKEGSGYYVRENSVVAGPFTTLRGAKKYAKELCRLKNRETKIVAKYNSREYNSRYDEENLDYTKDLPVSDDVYELGSGNKALDDEYRRNMIELMNDTSNSRTDGLITFEEGWACLFNRNKK